MTEADWTSSADPAAMLGFLRNRGFAPHDSGRVRERKFRLFAVACCRRIQAMLTDTGVTAIAAAELFADGLASDRDLHAAWGSVGFPKAPARRYAASAARATSCSPGNDLTGHAAASAVNAAVAVCPPAERDRVRRAEQAAQASLLRCIFGNPVRPASRDGSWRTSTAVALARQMYESRDFAAMPILGDALEEAGCGDEDVLNHCRRPGVHVRGCWVVDFVLGKA